jgi:hypothetical protein
VFIPSIIKDPNPSPDLNDCGCETPNEDNVMSLCISEKANNRFCDSSLTEATQSPYGGYFFSKKSFKRLVSACIYCPL